MSIGCRIKRWSCAIPLLCAAVALSATTPVVGQDEWLIDDLPDHITASMEARERLLAGLPQGDTPGFEFFVSDLQKWLTGSTVTVAFLGGDDALHRDIAEATKQITDAGNITLDFGLNPATGKYRTWSSSDAVHKADIRVSFDQGGNFSLVGRDSNNPSIGNPLQAIGGRAHQRSLNLGGYDQFRPASWKRTTRHEFLHALAFNHEHQSPIGGCDAQFRWENDPGYVPTKDGNQQYVNDSMGRRPGIYTFLSGAPNFWPKAKVDHNLRQEPAGSGSAGTFDRASIMLYRFPKLFYVSDPNPCAPISDSEDLSLGDIAGLKELYPNAMQEILVQNEREQRLMKAITESPRINENVKASLIAPQ
ncbi:MAG: hypothetical protein SGJ19_14755 [Planctomycetia bacterium]|nr:hypothetical protein [Planctomycetia bacterium]